MAAFVAAFVAVSVFEIRAVWVRRNETEQRANAYCHGAKGDACESLNANIRAANANEDAVDIGAIQLVLTLAGLGGVGWTLIYAHRAWFEARRSAQTAADALDDARQDAVAQAARFEAQLRVAERHANIAERTADGQLRAYLHMESVGVHWIADQPYFYGVCRNTGHTPAVSVNVGAAYGLADINAIALATTPFCSLKGDWGSVGGGADRLVAITAQTHAPFRRNEISATNMLWLRGRIYYEDIGGSRYSSEFAFFAQPTSDNMAATPGRLDMYQFLQGPNESSSENT